MFSRAPHTSLFDVPHRPCIIHHCMCPSSLLSSRSFRCIRHPVTAVWPYTRCQSTCAALPACCQATRPSQLDLTHRLSDARVHGSSCFNFILRQHSPALGNSNTLQLATATANATVGSAASKSNAAQARGSSRHLRTLRFSTRTVSYYLNVP